MKIRVVSSCGASSHRLIFRIKSSPTVLFVSKNTYADGISMKALSWKCGGNSSRYSQIWSLYCLEVVHLELRDYTRAVLEKN